MKFAKTLQMTANSLPEEYKGQVLNYKKFKKSINKIVTNMENTGVYEIPENENCKVIYSLSNSNKDGNDGEINSSLILYIDKDYAAELSQKDALEVNTEEITIDPKLKEVIELSDDASIEHEKVTKERIIKSFQLSDSNSSSIYSFNKQLSLKRLNQRSNSDSDKNISKNTEGGGRVRRNTIVDQSITKSRSKNSLKRSKSDGDKMEKIAKEKFAIKEEENNDISKSDAIIYSEPQDLEINNENSSSSKSSSVDDLPPIMPEDKPSLSDQEINANDNHNISDTNTNDNIKDSIPELEISNDIITNDDDDTNIKGKNIEGNDDVNDSDDIDNVNDADDAGVDGVIDCTTEANNNLSDEAATVNTMKSLKVLLEADAQFLNELAASLSHLSAFQDEYKKVFETKINIMANILSEVSSPNMKDTYRWRELLGIYCESNIWKYKGKDRTPDEVINQLRIFEGKADSICRKFKTKKSKTLLKEFIQLNYDIVAIKRFYELNQTAIYKILKKHDKRTHLLASEGFPQFARDETFFKDNIVRSLVFQISSRLLKVIPNPADYFCPICQEISYKPIRLDCGHLFCLRCLVKAKKMNIRDCPLCREPDVVYRANSSHVDKQLMHQLKHDFPKEVKAKLMDSRTEKAKEESEALLHMYGYGNPNQCRLM